MPASAQYTVTSTPVRLAKSNGAPLEVHLHCSQGSVYLDGSTVSTSTGYKLDNGQVITITVADNDELWAVASASSTLFVLVTTL